MTTAPTAYVIFVHISTEATIIPVECSLTATIKDVTAQLSYNRYGWRIIYQSSTIPHTAFLADEGIGPETQIVAEPDIDYTFTTNEELRDAVKNYEPGGPYGDSNKWDVSKVTNMAALFYGTKFNENISNWDVSNVIDTSFMFAESSFNQDISNWNLDKVKRMKFMFGESSFNQNISNWDININNNINTFAMFFNMKNADYHKPHWYSEKK